MTCVDRQKHHLYAWCVITFLVNITMCSSWNSKGVINSGHEIKIDVRNGEVYMTSKTLLHYFCVT